MQVSVTDAGTLRKQITISYDAAEVQAREQQLLNVYANRMNVKGFRKGKVPAGLVKKRFGKAVSGEAREALSQEGMQQAVQEHSLKPIGPIDSADGEQDAKDNKGLSISVVFDVAPEIELPEPKLIQVPEEDTSASAEEIDEELAALAKRAGEHVEIAADETVSKDDSITITGKVTAGDEVVRDVHDLNHIVGAYPLFGLDPEAVVELCADKKTGDSISFDSTLPENFKPEEHAGKAIHAELTIQKAQRLQEATIDDEFAKRLGAESAEELRERMTGMIESRKQQELHSRRLDALVDGLIEHTTFELPPKLFENAVNQQLDQSVARAKAQDESLDEEKHRDEQRESVTNDVDRDIRRQLLMQAIAEARSVQATQQDLQQQIQMAAYQSGRQPQEIAKQLQESGRIQEVAMDIRNHKALEVMLDEVLEANGQKTEPEPATAE